MEICLALGSWGTKHHGNEESDYSEQVQTSRDGVNHEPYLLQMNPERLRKDRLNNQRGDYFLCSDSWGSSTYRVQQGGEASGWKLSQQRRQVVHTGALWILLAKVP